jgi:hypothetical protein
MKDIIAEAQKARYTVEEGASGDKWIAISDARMAELQKHPYHSSKNIRLTFIEKPGSGIFLMKESSKLNRPHKEREQRWFAKRIDGQSDWSSDRRLPQLQ